MPSKPKKPPTSDTGDARIAVRLEHSLLRALDEKVERMRAERPAARITRSEGLRAAVLAFVVVK